MSHDTIAPGLVLKTASKIHWDRTDPVLDNLLSQAASDQGLDIEALEAPEVSLLLKELDRRLLQLWNKVAFEREHDLLDYSTVAARNNGEIHAPGVLMYVPKYDEMDGQREPVLIGLYHTPSDLECLENMAYLRFGSPVVSSIHPTRQIGGQRYLLTSGELKAYTLEVAA